MKGIYGLLVEAHDEIVIGRLGRVSFDGAYVYVGSAQGPGGLAKRVARHRAMASGDVPARHWHIDYLLAISRRLEVLGAETADPDAECALAHELARRTASAIRAFGASDCRCQSHLFRTPAWNEALLVEAFASLGLRPVKGLWR